MSLEPPAPAARRCSEPRWALRHRLNAVPDAAPDDAAPDDAAPDDAAPGPLVSGNAVPDCAAPGDRARRCGIGRRGDGARDIGLRCRIPLRRACRCDARCSATERRRGRIHDTRRLCRTGLRAVRLRRVDLVVAAPPCAGSPGGAGERLAGATRGRRAIRLAVSGRRRGGIRLIRLAGGASGRRAIGLTGDAWLRADIALSGVAGRRRELLRRNGSRRGQRCGTQVLRPCAGAQQRGGESGQSERLPLSPDNAGGHCRASDFACHGQGGSRWTLRAGPNRRHPAGPRRGWHLAVARATTGRATTGRATTGRATTGRATTGRATTGRATTGRATTGRASMRNMATPSLAAAAISR